MPIKQLTPDQMGLPRAGVIRLGYKTRKCQKELCGHILTHPERQAKTCPRCNGELGKEFPTEAGYFILDDAPGVAEIIKTNTPTELKVFFPFDDANLIFPNFMQAWSAASLICRGDGEQIVYAIEPSTGKIKIRDGVALMDFTEGNKPYKAGQPMACPGPERNLYPKCQNCKPNAMLIVLLRDIPRLAYWQISTTSIHNIVELQKQLNTVKEIIGGLIGTQKLSGIPFILKRVKRTVSAPKKDRNGKETGRQRVEKWFLQLEIEPDWVMKMLTAQRRLADPMARFMLTPGPQASQPTVDIFDPEPTAPKVPLGFAEPPQWEPHIVEEPEFEEIPEEPTEPVQPAQPNPKARPVLSPAELKAALEKKVAKSNLIDPETLEPLPITLHPFGDKTANLVSSKFQAAIGTDPKAEEMYHDTLKWLTGKESATELTAPWADALLDWLLNGNKDAGWRAIVMAPAPGEAYTVYQEVVKAKREAMKAAGQVEMALDETTDPNDLNAWFPREEA